MSILCSSSVILPMEKCTEISAKLLIPLGSGSQYIIPSPQRNFIATASDSNCINIWDRASLCLLTSLKHSEEIKGLVFSPDENFTLTYGRGTAYIWKTKTGTLLYTLSISHSLALASFSPSSKYVLTLLGGKVYIWDVQTGKQIQIIEKQILIHRGSLDGIGDAKFLEDHLVIVISVYGEISIWDINTGTFKTNKID
ncbi:MAG: hypothetical protein US13_C0014G0009 [candidate division TM6 bacterium GW2011_GWE2_36_25]|nr:MAG: hypothetical protein US03_C0013G0009 [candidate division TM6 bacterium GW2011_GWF2_36_131]KKQ02552.1 MAG: hypothetical protein US13_C0014G0009 [candidate division TM6 bacterium GW2011_GWE2_36_25]KKQ19307.1 MAG: hypothetical protein US32_C0011G0009 [candidate division TM6 bacterium GW2011_GWA2_36_9]